MLVEVPREEEASIYNVPADDDLIHRLGIATSHRQSTQPPPRQNQSHLKGEYPASIS